MRGDEFGGEARDRLVSLVEETFVAVFVFVAVEKLVVGCMRPPPA